jgi:hypothetical protein
MDVAARLNRTEPQQIMQTIFSKFFGGVGTDVCRSCLHDDAV